MVKKAMIALVACSMSAGPALAAPSLERCPNAREMEAFEARQVQIEFMVAALSCQGVVSEKYNNFMRKFGPALGSESQTFQAYFKRTYGRASTREVDSYLTSTANDVSQRALSTRDFCNDENRSLDSVLAINYTGLTPETLHAIDITTPARAGCRPRPALKTVVASAAPATASSATPAATAGSAPPATAAVPATTASGAAKPRPAASATASAATPSPAVAPVAFVPHGITVGPDGTPIDTSEPTKTVVASTSPRPRHTR